MCSLAVVEPPSGVASLRTAAAGEYWNARIIPPLPMADEARDYLIRLFETAWKLTRFPLNGLTTKECLWRPASDGLHVHQDPMEAGGPTGRVTSDMISVRRASRG